MAKKTSMISGQAMSSALLSIEQSSRDVKPTPHLENRAPDMRADALLGAAFTVAKTVGGMMTSEAQAESNLLARTSSTGAEYQKRFDEKVKPKMMVNFLLDPIGSYETLSGAGRTAELIEVKREETAQKEQLKLIREQEREQKRIVRERERDARRMARMEYGLYLKKVTKARETANDFTEWDRNAQQNLANVRETNPLPPEYQKMFSDVRADTKKYFQDQSSPTNPVRQEQTSVAWAKEATKAYLADAGANGVSPQGAKNFLDKAGETLPANSTGKAVQTNMIEDVITNISDPQVANKVLETYKEEFTPEQQTNLKARIKQTASEAPNVVSKAIADYRVYVNAEHAAGRYVVHAQEKKLTKEQILLNRMLMHIDATRMNSKQIQALAANESIPSSARSSLITLGNKKDQAYALDFVRAASNEGRMLKYEDSYVPVAIPNVRMDSTNFTNAELDSLASTTFMRRSLFDQVMAERGEIPPRATPFEKNENKKLEELYKSCLTPQQKWDLSQAVTYGLDAKYYSENGYMAGTDSVDTIAMAADSLGDQDLVPFLAMERANPGMGSKYWNAYETASITHPDQLKTLESGMYDKISKDLANNPGLTIEQKKGYAKLASADFVMEKKENIADISKLREKKYHIGKVVTYDAPGIFHTPQFPYVVLPGKNIMKDPWGTLNKTLKSNKLPNGENLNHWLEMGELEGVKIVERRLVNVGDSLTNFQIIYQTDKGKAKDTWHVLRENGRNGNPIIITLPIS